MSISKEQYDWFNNLPRKWLGTRFESECHCGETVWFEVETLDVQSWIERHFGHTKPSMSVKKPFVYDWSIAWRFSKEGFLALWQDMERGSWKYSQNSTDENQEIYAVVKDDKDNSFVFRVYNTPPPNPDYPFENHWATFCPEKSLVSL